MSSNKSFVVVFLQLVQTALAAVTVIYLANMLRATDYGNYVYYITIASIMPLFAGLGGEHVFLMEGSKHTKLIPFLFGNALFVRSVCSAILVLVASLFFLIVSEENATSILLIITGTLVATFSNPLFLSLYRVKGIHIRPWVISFSGYVIYIVYLLVLPRSLVSLASVSLGYFISHLFTLAVFLIDIRGKISLRLSFRLQKRLLRRGFFFSASQVFDYAFSRLDILLIQMISGPLFVGIYAAGQRLVSMLQLIPSSFHVVELPEFHRASANKKLLEQKFSNLRSLMTELAFLFFGLLILNADFIINLLFKSEYAAASTVVVWLSVSYILLFINYPYYMLAEALNKIKERLMYRIYTFIATAASIVLLLYLFGINGAAIGLIIGQGVFMLLLHKLTAECNGGVQQFFKDVKSIVIALLAIVIAFALGQLIQDVYLRMLVTSLVYILVFLIVGIWLKFVTCFGTLIPTGLKGGFMVKQKSIEQH